MSNKDTRLKVYEYKGCGTCRKALQYLDMKKVVYEKLAIRETPPTLKELQFMLENVDGNIRKLFNTSGQDYKLLGMKDKIGKLTESELLKMLSKNGNLIKRPFVVGKNFGLVGFDAKIWKEKLS